MPHTQSRICRLAAKRTPVEYPEDFREVTILGELKDVAKLSDAEKLEMRRIDQLVAQPISGRKLLENYREVEDWEYSRRFTRQDFVQPNAQKTYPGFTDGSLTYGEPTPYFSESVLLQVMGDQGFSPRGRKLNSVGAIQITFSNGQERVIHLSNKSPTRPYFASDTGRTGVSQPHSL